MCVYVLFTHFHYPHPLPALLLLLGRYEDEVEDERRWLKDVDVGVGSILLSSSLFLTTLLFFFFVFCTCSSYIFCCVSLTLRRSLSSTESRVGSFADSRERRFSLLKRYSRIWFCTTTNMINAPTTYHPYNLRKIVNTSILCLCITVHKISIRTCIHLWHLYNLYIYTST